MPQAHYVGDSVAGVGIAPIMTETGGGAGGPTPVWDGRPESFADYKRGLKLLVLGTKKDDRGLLGPRIAAKLVGNAWANSGNLDLQKLATEKGVDYLVELLEEAMATIPGKTRGTSLYSYFSTHHRCKCETMRGYQNATLLKIREMEKATSEALTKKKIDHKPEDVKVPGVVHAVLLGQNGNASPGEEEHRDKSRRRSRLRGCEEGFCGIMERLHGLEPSPSER